MHRLSTVINPNDLCTTDTERTAPVIAVCICTRNRPTMLEACVKSVVDSANYAQLRVVICVVDDNDIAGNVELAHQYTSELISLQVIRNITHGLSYARNTALAAAYTNKADWIAFIDDDEIAALPWLAELYRSVYFHGKERQFTVRPINTGKLTVCDVLSPVTVVHGIVHYAFPQGAADWRCREPWGSWGDTDGKELDCAGTGNVMFDAHFVRRHRLQFDTAMNYSGAEDVAFFHRIHELGGKIVLSTRAIVTETVTADRITLKGHAKKAYRNGNIKVYHTRLTGRYKPRKTVRRALKRLIVGSGKLTVGIAVAAVTRTKGMTLALKGMYEIIGAIGAIAAVCGKRSNYYKVTTGN